jgi:hypothetical protein
MSAAMDGFSRRFWAHELPKDRDKWGKRAGSETRPSLVPIEAWVKRSGGFAS